MSKINTFTSVLIIMLTSVFTCLPISTLTSVLRRMLLNVLTCVRLKRFL